MSHIRQKEELLKLRKYITSLGRDDVDIKTISELFNDVVPKNEYQKNSVGVIVSGCNKKELPGYLPIQNTINIPRKTFLESTEISGENISKIYNYNDITKMIAFYRVFAALHEVEHAYQFLIIEDKIDFPFKEVKEDYKTLIDYLYEIPNGILNASRRRKSNFAFKKYNENPYDYILERNANVEAANDISFVASTMEEKEISRIFDSLKISFTAIGYEEDNLGCMMHTFQSLLPKKEYDKILRDENMSEEDRIRFGLEISNESHKKLMKKINDNGVFL